MTLNELPILLVIIAAIALALNQAVKDMPNVTEKFPAVALPGWFAYVPIAVLLLAGLIYWASLAGGAEADPPARLVQAAETQAPVSSATKAAEDSEKASTTLEEVGNPTRTLEAMPYGTAAQLAGIMRGYVGTTNLEGEMAAREFEDYFFEVSGRVDDVRMTGSTSVQLTVKPRANASYFVTFPLSTPKIEQTKIGDRISGVCKFGGNNAGKYYVSLYRCVKFKRL